MWLCQAARLESGVLVLLHVKSPYSLAYSRAASSSYGNTWPCSRLLLLLDVQTANFPYPLYIRLCLFLLSPPSPPPPSPPSFPLLPPLSLFLFFFLSLSIYIYLSHTVSYSPSLNLRIPSLCSVFTF